MMLRLTAAVFLLAHPVAAEAPRVVADIAPVHSLVAQVMEGVGQPGLLLPANTNPHHQSLRPSQARMLQDADLVIWVGTGLTPWLQGPLSTLAGQAEQIILTDAPGTVQRAYRVSEDMDGHDDDDAGHDHDDHAEDHDHEGHDHEGDVDPHVWLDPENGRIWLNVIADQLSRQDAGNAAVYRQNAQAASERLGKVIQEVDEILAPVKSRPFVTFHDAFQYFEARFGLTFAGAISLGDAADPSPAQLDRIRTHLLGGDIRCAFREPQFNDRLLQSAAENIDLEIGVLDPLGSELDAGPGLYSDVMREMAHAMAACR